jgi:hypothetical protein
VLEVCCQQHAAPGCNYTAPAAHCHNSTISGPRVPIASRQCKRTAITESTVDFWLVLDRLPPMELDDLHRAGDSLTSALQAASPQSRVESRLLAP